MRDVPLYHWAPTARRKQIVRYGLRPGMRSTMSAGWKPPYICFAETPSWAWALSGDFHPDILSWDLWQTSLACLREPRRKPTFDNTHRWHEVRTAHRVYKRDIWYVGSR